MSIMRPATGWEYERVTEHPGEILREEFMVPLGLSANALAIRLRISPPRLHAILHGKRSITPDTAMRLGRCFNTSAQMWLNMQQLHDLTKAQQLSGKKIQQEVEPLKMAAAA
jgi:antitoxin HigA-1